MAAVSAASDDLLGLPVEALLELLASEAPTPGAGAVAALTAAMAAGLVGMVASASPEWSENAAATAQAQALRRRLGPLAAANAEAYQAALVSLALSDEVAPDVRSFSIQQALGRAAEQPLRIAGAAADVALLAAEVAERCEPALRPDVTVAAVLAGGSARAAAHLVEINLTTTDDDPRVIGARALAADASYTATRLLDSAAAEP
jgi:formiminotetrahydrofolate cyclodeaminase